MGSVATYAFSAAVAVASCLAGSASAQVASPEEVLLNSAPPEPAHLLATTSSGKGNRAFGIQIGQDNQILLSQAPPAGLARSVAAAVQAGVGNQFSLAQNGILNLAGVAQTGNANSFEVTQNGDANVLLGAQVGDQLAITVTQHGGSIIGVAQSSGF